MLIFVIAPAIDNDRLQLDDLVMRRYRKCHKEFLPKQILESEDQMFHSNKAHGCFPRIRWLSNRFQEPQQDKQKTTKTRTRASLINTFMWFQIIILLHALRHNCLIKCLGLWRLKRNEDTLAKPHKHKARQRESERDGKWRRNESNQIKQTPYT